MFPVHNTILGQGFSNIPGRNSIFGGQFLRGNANSTSGYSYKTSSLFRRLFLGRSLSSRLVLGITSLLIPLYHSVDKRFLDSHCRKVFKSENFTSMIVLYVESANECSHLLPIKALHYLTRCVFLL